jgi:hypothetical protein
VSPGPTDRRPDAFVTPGKAHTLALRVVAATDAKEVLNFMETASAQVSTTAATLDTRGITGDVILRSRPKGAHIDGLFVRTSVRKKELTVETELAGVTQAGAGHGNGARAEPGRNRGKNVPGHGERRGEAVAIRRGHLAVGRREAMGFRQTEPVSGS